MKLNLILSKQSVRGSTLGSRLRQRHHSDYRRRSRRYVWRCDAAPHAGESIDKKFIQSSNLSTLFYRLLCIAKSSQESCAHVISSIIFQLTSGFLLDIQSYVDRTILHVALPPTSLFSGLLRTEATTFPSRHRRSTRILHSSSSSSSSSCSSSSSSSSSSSQHLQVP